MSAELEDRTVGGVSIRSERGRDCTLAHPWPGRSFELVRGSGKVEGVSGERFTFRTSAGETLECRPSS